MSDSQASVPRPVNTSSQIGTHHSLRAVLRIAPFQKLWVALSLSSFGDWLGLLATTALASQLSGSGYAKQGAAISGVFILRLIPAVFFGPIAGVVADQLDRRWTMVVCDLLRFVLFASVAVAHSLWWLYVATFLIEVAALFWIPAKEATVPNLVPPDKLEAANQISLVTTYGSAPVAAAVFTALSLVNSLLAAGIGFVSTNSVDMALFFNAFTFLFSAITIYRLKEIPKASAAPLSVPSVLKTLAEGWRFVARTKVVRGLIIGILGAFAAGGFVVGLAKQYVTDLGAGNAGYGVLFGTVFLGMAVGMFAGPRLLSGFSRRRLFGLALVGAGVSLCLVALIPNLVIVVLFTGMLGTFTGVAWVSGYTLLGLEVADALRGRTFAFVQSLVRVTLVLVLASAPLIAGPLGVHTYNLTRSAALTYNGAAITLFLAGLAAVGVGLLAYRQMDDRPGVALLADLTAAIRGEEPPAVERRGYFLALEGGDGSGKTTQADRLAAWLREVGHDVVLTREPGGSGIGERLRSLLLQPGDHGPSPRAEALLYAADRAEHVDRVIQPALERGAVVITDRYQDSSVAYQAGGRGLPATEVAKLSKWATHGLRPNLTVVLDVPPAVGLRRRGAEPDRLEAEPLEFHERVRSAYRQLAARHRSRYLVVDATQQPETIMGEIKARLTEVLPPSETQRRAQEERERQTHQEMETRRLAEEKARTEQLALVTRCREEAERRRREKAERLEAERREEAERRRAEQHRREEAERRRAEQHRREEAERRRAEQHRREEAERLEAERLEAERREAERQEAERVAAQRAAAERRAADQARRRSMEEETEVLPVVSAKPYPLGPDDRTEVLPPARPGSAEPDASGADETQVLSPIRDTDPGGEATEQIPAVPADDRNGVEYAELLPEEAPSLADDLLGPWPSRDEENRGRSRRGRG